MFSRRKRFLLVLGFGITAFFFLVLRSTLTRSILLADYEAARETEVKERAAAAYIVQALFGGDVLGAGTKLVAEQADLSDGSRGFLKNLALAREVEARFRAQEGLLRSVGLLLRANKNDLIAREYLERAALLSEHNQAALAELQEIAGDCRWNARLRYLQGAVLTRALVFVKHSEQFRALDLIEQAVKNFESVFALACMPRVRPEVAIELLYTQQKERSSDGGALTVGDLQLKLLPQAELGPGTGGRDRQHGRH